MLSAQLGSLKLHSHQKRNCLFCCAQMYLQHLVWYFVPSSYSINIQWFSNAWPSVETALLEDTGVLYQCSILLAFQTSSTFIHSLIHSSIYPSPCSETSAFCRSYAIQVARANIHYFLQELTLKFDVLSYYSRGVRHSARPFSCTHWPRHSFPLSPDRTSESFWIWCSRELLQIKQRCWWVEPLWHASTTLFCSLSLLISFAYMGTSEQECPWEY